MEIILVIYGSIEQVSGGYLYDRKVVSRLREKGVGVRIYNLPKRPYLLSVLQGFTGSVRVLCRDACSKQEDRPLLVVDELTHPSFFLPLLFRSRPIPRLVTLVHHLRIEEHRGIMGRFIARMFEMVLLNRSGFIIVNSSVTEDSIRRILKNKTPVRVCRPGCDTFLPLCGATVQEKRRTSGEEVQLLTVGNIIPRKGQLALIRTLLTMVGMSWRLIIVGRDDRETRYSRYLHAVINAGGIGHRVNITGTLSDTEIVKLYRTSDVFIFPSRYEGYGIALAEALSYGLPYAAFNSGGIREICGPVQSGFTLPLNEQRAEKAKSSGQMRDGRSPGAVRCRGGFLVNRDQPETFRIVLERLITDRELRNSLSAEALERFKELPIWEQTGDCFYHALQEAVDLLVT